MQWLDRTHVSVNIPEEQIFHVNGVPRHEWNPPVLVDLVATRGQADPELAAAERVLTSRIAESGETRLSYRNHCEMVRYATDCSISGASDNAACPG